MKTLFTTMKKTNLKYGRFVLFIVVSSIVMSVGMVFLYRLRGDLSEAVIAGDVNHFLWLLVFATGITIVRALFSAISTFLLARFTANGSYNLRKHFMNHFLRVPFAKVEQVASGERLSVYSNDLPKAEQFITSGITEFVGDFAAFVAALVFMLFISPAFTGVLFLTGIVIMLIMVVVSLPIKKKEQVSSEKEAKFNATVKDSLQNLSVVAAYSLDEELEKRYTAAYFDYFNYVKKVIRALVPVICVMGLVISAPIAVVHVVLAFSTLDGNLYLAEFVAFVATATFALGGMASVASHFSNLMSGAAKAKRFNDTTADALENFDTGVAVAHTGAVSLEFKNVSFAYNEEASVLDGTSFTIPAGGKVAIVGGSGSGKSTILKLLMGLYDASGGEIFVNGQNIAEISKEGIRNTFAYVPQNSFLFPQSIKDNITQGETDMPRLEKACADAEILDFINSLPNGFDTLLTESAENVSGGQRQRIAMARAFYKNAPVILFDEATSSLDPTTEAAILESLAKVAVGKTIILVAHRETAIAACDMVINLSNGKEIGA